MIFLPNERHFYNIGNRAWKISLPMLHLFWHFLFNGFTLPLRLMGALLPYSSPAGRRVVNLCLMLFEHKDSPFFFLPGILCRPPKRCVFI